MATGCCYGNWLLLWQHYHSNTVHVHVNAYYFIFIFPEPGSGLLRFQMMQIMFSEKKVSSEQALLIFSFLHQYGVLLPVDKETALVPSMLSPIPTVRGREAGVHVLVHVRDETFVKELGHMYSKSIH